MKLTRRDLLAFASGSALALPASQLIAAEKMSAAKTLKDAFKKDFYVGAALSASIVKNKDPKLMAIIARDFNSVTPENCMKWGEIRNEDGSWNWGDADAYVDFGTQHNMYSVGHTLVWHSQIPDGVFKNKDGNYISKEALLGKMQDHITTLAGRYKGRLQAWDVVNEAMDDNLKMRESHWYKILGDDFIYKAFNFAHEVDPKAHLMYNDYNIENTGKREAVVEMIKRLQKRGMPIHGLGIQGHVNIETPSIKEIEKSIVAFAKLGLRVHFTELDVDVLPSVWNIPVAEISTRFDYTPERDPYTTGLPQKVQDKLARRYEALFKLFRKHKDNIERVTTWGVSDDASWLNDFPIKGRTNYPLLFDRKQEPKSAYFRLLDMK